MMTLEKMHVRFFVSEERVHDGIVIPRLCHRERIVTVETGTEDLSNCDGVLTENRDLTLGITTADCLPICFSDGKKIGVIHAGWRGLCLGIVERALASFDPATVEIFVGPHLHSFEIQKDFCYDAIVAKFGERFLSEKEGKIIFHFKDASASVLPSHTVFDPRNTIEDLSLPSYRRDKTTQRLITVVSFTA